MKTIIKPSAAIRQDYNGIAKLCRESAAPVYLTKNGKGDLVVMDIDNYNRREASFSLREELLGIEEARRDGVPDYSCDDVVEMMRQAVKEAAKK
ncbi:MAG: type II toxin-antitoxin system Phd/YefM family antitoxin [Anaerovibrio sp.]|uniref:prevent-host-death protein n=1 Tax=Anaerovibrio sp. TaxID=1872532 RepID=UPI0025CC4FFA|nr:prevent-host-death protein [Anaerovibrio sp.]MCR5175462.1 type II toxin-antitoxin system Phd/YefM family antitoxin [Anaerovibrio sp.]